MKLTARPAGPRTLGDLAGQLALRSPAAVEVGGGWTDTDIERPMVALVEAEFGVDMAEFTLDSGVIDDMGVDQAAA